ncbi:hypothetical protein HO173_003416 [Letharia columbiana]|uniref:Uncharacterized protein n=1 Tax=Letharia columbiana TaxID=112416 RepID=A0A8H6L7C5_9LECA|nr:uncharacterized protein HO173_003416 [Letharia columbiana]KAF6238449.1 hypothetical protein HO173_003416 [Letharia columbiana]
MFPVLLCSPGSLVATPPALIRYLASLSLIEGRALPAQQTPFCPYKPSRALVRVKMDSTTADWNNFLGSGVYSEIVSTDFGLQGCEAG